MVRRFAGVPGSAPTCTIPLTGLAVENVSRAPGGWTTFGDANVARAGCEVQAAAVPGPGRDRAGQRRRIGGHAHGHRVRVEFVGRVEYPAAGARAGNATAPAAVGRVMPGVAGPAVEADAPVVSAAPAYSGDPWVFSVWVPRQVSLVATTRPAFSPQFPRKSKYSWISKPTGFTS